MAKLINRIRHRIADQKIAPFIDIWKCGGQCVISVEAMGPGVYETKTVNVYALSHLNDEKWLAEVNGAVAEWKVAGVFERGIW